MKEDRFPESWDEKSKEAKEEIARISKAIEDVNRAIMYREDPRVIANESLFKRQNKVITDESENVSFYIHLLSKKNMDGLGEFLVGALTG